MAYSLFVLSGYSQIIGGADALITLTAGAGHTEEFTWNETGLYGPTPVADLNGDKRVDILDIAMIARNFGKKL